MTETKDEPIFTFRRSHLWVALTTIAFLVGLLTGYILWGRNLAPAQTSLTAATQSPAAQAVKLTPTSKVVRYTVPVGDAPARGAADAPITIIEFSDFEDPYCQKWQQEVFPQLMANYANKIHFVVRNFPLSIHPNARPAAEAALCANEQGKYWEYHDKLFSLTLPLGDAAYTQYASDMGLDMTKFNDCLNSHRYQAKIQADVDFASNLGVDQTPTFFINGLAVIGAQPYTFFQQVIDQELAGEIK